MTVSAGSQVQVVAVVDGRVVRSTCRVASITAATMVLVPANVDLAVASGHDVDLIVEGRSWRQGVVIAGRESFTIWRPSDLDTDDARRTSRTRTDLPATIRTDDHRFAARIHDLSARGCRVDLIDGRLALGDVVAIAFHGLELLARAMSSSHDAAVDCDRTQDDSGGTYGLAFERTTPETTGRLFRLIGEIRSAAQIDAATAG